MTDAPRPEATIRIATTDQVGRIDPNIYGHFLENAFFGNIEGGVFDEGSPRSQGSEELLAGMREDVIDACRELGVPVMRWPGGNYASSYHWRDGIGPRDERPRRLDLNWGGEDSNRFGTDEFLAWCAAIGAEPYLVHGCRSVDDAVRWVEYANYGGDTELTRQRARNGRAEPWRVRYWGVGNEVYGPWQMGYRPAGRYAADAREHARFMRQVDPALRLIGVGLEDEHWTREVLTVAGPWLDTLSIHLYGGSDHLFAGDVAGNYDAIVAQSIHFEEAIRAYAGLVTTLSERAGLERPPALALDEWNMRHLEPAAWPEPERGVNGGVAPRATVPVDLDAPRAFRVNRYSPRTLADALFYAGVLHALQRLSELDAAPTMANTVNLVNANPLLEVRPDGLVRSATYAVWSLLQHHTGPIAVRAETESPGATREIVRDPVPDAHGRFPSRPGYVPDLDVSASLSADRSRLHLSVINRHRERTITVRLMLDGSDRLPNRADIHDLGATGGDVLAHNTMGRPDAVAIRTRTDQPLPADGSYAFPPHSVTVLTMCL